MFSELSFDELNNLNSVHKSVDFEEYFGEMKISKAEKTRRISLAEKLEDKFLVVLALLFTWRKYGAMTTAKWMEVQSRFKDGYEKAMQGLITSDSYLTGYVQNFAKEVTESTQKHQENEYYYTSDRARYIAECEANNTGSYQEFKDMLQAGYTKKQWVTIIDGHERETHHETAGQIKNIWEPFIVGGYSMNFPRDSSGGAGAEEIAGCRCSLKYIK